MTPLFSRAQIREIEAASNPSAGLMEKAGLAVASLAKELLHEDASRILLVAGPGNNGGDAFVAARYLKAWWYQVTLVFSGVGEQLPADARAAYEGWLACGGECLETIPPNVRWDLVIDGLFGIGLKRPLEGAHAALVQSINALHTTVLAIDIPSGLEAETGNVLGQAVRADHTVTFLGLKPGLFTMDGPEHAGRIYHESLGTDAPFEPVGWLVNAPPALLPRRPLNSHKGRNGNLGVVGGNSGMVGAALLASRAGFLSGAGRVFCGLLADSKPVVDMLHPELMLREPEELLTPELLSVLAMGPGMGTDLRAGELVRHALTLPLPLILDADALNLLAMHKVLQQAAAERAWETTIITPHPGEAALLLNVTTAELQWDRVGSALQLAEKYNAVTVLKGCGTVTACPNGRWYINASGNPGLSSAGMGDTLTGLLGGLAAQGMSLADAALLGVYLHGAAADNLVESGTGPFGLTASEVAVACRRLLNQWVYTPESTG